MQNAPNTWQCVTDTPDKLGESPFWHPREEELYWVDIPGRKINRLDVGSGVVDTWHLPQEPGCIAPARRGGLVIAMRDGVYRANDWASDLELIAPAPYDTATTRFNDGKCDYLGRLWVGTIFEPRTSPAAALYCVDARQTHGTLTARAARVTPMQTEATVGNGLAWSPDHQTIYWADTAQHVVRAWDWEADTGAMTHGRVFHQFAKKPEAWSADLALAHRYGGRPDGCAVDVQGNYYVAMFEGQCLQKLSPEGDIIATIPTPSRCTTMPCFGDADLKTLYITTAAQGRSAAEIAAYPQSGHVFSMRVDVPGLPVNFFED